MDDNIVQLTDSNKMKEQGALWLARLDRGLSAEEEVLLKAWLAQSQENRTYFVALAKKWDQLSILSGLAEVIPYERKSVTIPFLRYAKAASFALVFLLGSFLFVGLDTFSDNNTLLTTKADFSHRYQTSIGEKSVIRLPDSSVLTLNTDSLVTVHFTAMTRKLILEKGEAHIKVAHNKKRKLIFSAGDKSFIAIGTAFNLQYDTALAVELIVTEGKVAIADTELNDFTEKVETLFTNPINKEILLVNAGERVVIMPKDSTQNKTITKENITKKINKTLAWHKGKLIFKGETLEEVIKEMSRYSNIDIEVKGTHLKNTRIGGRFKTGDIEGLLDVLNEQFNIKANKIGRSRIQLTQVKPT